MVTIRKILDRCQEAYELGACPPINRIYDTMAQDASPIPYDETPIAQARAKLLEIGIDTKRIYQKHIAKIIKRHGKKRAERLTVYLKEGYIARFSEHHQKETLFDAKILKNSISYYLKR